MKALHAVTYLLLSLSLLTPSIATDWRPYGPPGGAVLALLDGGPELYAVCSQVVYRSVDEGNTWGPLEFLSDNRTFRDGVIVRTATPTLIVCLDTGGILVWDSSAETWIESNSGIDPPPLGYALQGFDLSLATPDATRVFFGGSTGLYYSDNQGQSWTKVAYPNPSYLPTKVEAASDGSVYIYTYTPIRIESNLTDSVFFVMKPGLPSRALDQAMIWPSPENPLELLLTLPSYPTQAETSVFYSSDGGENWSQPSLGAVPYKALRGTWLLGAPTIFGASGTYVLDGARTTWSLGWDFLRPSQWKVLTLGSPGHFLRGSSDRGVWRTENSAGSWTYSSAGMGNYGNLGGIAVDPSDDQVLYVGMQSSGVWKTEDDGETWREINSGFRIDPYYGVSIRSLALDPNNPLHLLAGTEVSGGLPAAVHETWNGGASWSPIANGPTFLADKVHFVRSSPGTILLGTLGGGVWRSPDNGTNWAPNAAFPQYSNITDIAEEAGGRLFACQTATFNTQGGVFVSDTGGVSWTFDESPGGFRSMAADASTPGRIMGGLPGGGMLFTNNNGLSWSPANNGLMMSYGTYGTADCLVSHPLDSGHFFVSLDGNGIYETENEGGLWTRLQPDEGDPYLRGPIACSLREGGTLYSSDSGVYYTQLEAPIPGPTETPSPSPTATNPVGPNPTPTFTPPDWFPDPRTPTPTPAQSLNVGIERGSLSIQPKSPSTNGDVTVGAVVYNDSRTNLTNVRVDCYWRREGGPENHFAQLYLPSLFANFFLEVPIAGTFQPAEGGTYYISVRVDEGGALSESNEGDNAQETAFYVRQAGADFTPPAGSVEVNGGSPFTSNWEVNLSFPATDAGSGVAFLWVEAFAYDAYTGRLDSYFNSGWVDYQPSAQFFISGVWTGDIDAFAVNYADWDGNVSDTYYTAVTFCQNQFTEFVFYDELVYYPVFLVPGQTATITLQNVWGDADLFVIAPSDPPGWTSWVSQNDGAVTENIGFTAVEEGIYWIAVFGYDFAEYRLLCSGSGKGNVAGESPQGSLPRKDRRAPVLQVPDSVAPLTQGIEVPSIAVDFDGNGTMDNADLFYLASKWGIREGVTGFDARCGGLGTTNTIGASHLLKWISMGMRQ